MGIVTDRYAKFPPFRSFTQRLRSFDGYGGILSPTALARAGFFYVHEDQDTVQCFYCGVRIYQWEQNDDPVMEHLTWGPDCWFADTISHVRDVERQLEENKANHAMTRRLHSYCGKDEARNKGEMQDELLLRMIQFVFYQ